MGSKPYDAIVVGARCAGSPTAMLLARKGYRVLMVDKGHFPSDTLSSHFVHQQGVGYLARWGLLDRLRATGVPDVRKTTLDFGRFAIRGQAFAGDGPGEAYAPRRMILDGILVEAAAEAGVEIRERFTFHSLEFEEGRVVGIRGTSTGKDIVEHGSIVIGADGPRSAVAREAGAPAYDEAPTQAATYYSYWTGVPTDGLEIFIRPERSWGMFPTHDGLTCIVMSWPAAEFEANRHDVEGNFMKTLEFAPDVADRAARGKHVERFKGTGDAPNFFRRPYGDGWALVGDAGYHKDPCTAQGISDGFRDAGSLTEAIDDGFCGRETMDEALAGYEKRRNEHAMPIYKFTLDLASLAPPPPDQLRLLTAVAQNREASDAFVSLLAGTNSFEAFFAPDNVARILGEAI